MKEVGRRRRGARDESINRSSDRGERRGRAGKCWGCWKESLTSPAVTYTLFLSSTRLCLVSLLYINTSVTARAENTEWGRLLTGFFQPHTSTLEHESLRGNPKQSKESKTSMFWFKMDYKQNVLFWHYCYCFYAWTKKYNSVRQKVWTYILLFYYRCSTFLNIGVWLKYKEHK